MTMEIDRNNESNETPLPEKLVGALRRTQARQIFVPRTVDEAILRAAQKQLATRPSFADRKFSFWLRWAAAVAACALLAALLFPATRSFERGSISIHKDLNHDGRVDVLDAFQLARDLQDGKQVPASNDVNGDGVVDDRDVAVLATRAVKLEKGNPS